MFSLMKNPGKDNPASDHPVSLHELYAGSVVGFGFMPQKKYQRQAYRSG